jgi:predicted O-methyltransferase YrrM
MPELRAKFSKTEVVTFDVDEEHKLIIKQNLRSKEVLDRSLEQRGDVRRQFRYVAGSQSIRKIAEDDIDCRIKRYSKCLSQCSKITAVAC